MSLDRWLQPSSQPNTQKGGEQVRYIGVDVGKNRCQACIMDEEGVGVEEFPFTNTWEGIQALLEKTGDTKSKAVVESTGNLRLRIYEALEGHGVEVKLANPYKTKAIASARIKTDKLSARILAHLLRADLIAECYVAPREVRQVRALLRQRASLVKMVFCVLILSNLSALFARFRIDLLLKGAWRFLVPLSVLQVMAVVALTGLM
jgi:transposase